MTIQKYSSIRDAKYIILAVSCVSFQPWMLAGFFREIRLESASNCLNTFLHILWWIYRFTNQSNFQQQQSHLLETWSYLATWASFGPSCCCCCCCFCSWMKNQTTTVASVTDLRKKTKMLTNYNSTQWIISKWWLQPKLFFERLMSHCSS